LLLLLHVKKEGRACCYQESKQEKEQEPRHAEPGLALTFSQFKNMRQKTMIRTKQQGAVRGGLLVALVQKTMLLNDRLIEEFNKDAAKFFRKK
ncbi:hypothetical protein LCGC14_2676490, partial [marine sediment metagenome]